MLMLILMASLALQFPGSNTPTELLNALPYLEKLQRLSLSNNPPDTRLHRPAPLWMGILEPLLRCLQLKALDMTYTDMNITAVSISICLEFVDKCLLRQISRCYL